jgi:hypothetical protein
MSVVNIEKFVDIFEVDLSKYKFIYQETSSGMGRIVQRSLRAGQHLARHYEYTGPAEFENKIIVRKINKWAAQKILSRVNELGDTLAFTAAAFESDKLNNRKKSIKPENIRHIKTKQELSFTSTGTKLVHHRPIFKKLKETGYGSIIRATMTNHQVCSSRCSYCSTIGREKKDSISLEEAKDFFNKLYFDQAEFNKAKFPEYNEEYKKITGSDIRLRGLIMSGGGQPNLWPHFTDFINYVSNHEVSLGLITNGFPLNVNEKVYSKFEWIRLSITPSDASSFYKDGLFENQPLPNFRKLSPNITLGISYVYGPWTNDEDLVRLNDFCLKNDFNYCRLLTDCNLDRVEQLLQHQKLAERLYNLALIDKDGNPLGKIFHQLKYHATEEETNDVWSEGQCFLQSYSVFWDTTGHEENGESYCYPCDSVTVLAHSNDTEVTSSERRFNHSKWGTVKNKEVSLLYENKLTPYFDPKKECKGCLFLNNNIMVKKLMTDENINVNGDIEHVNFP